MLSRAIIWFIYFKFRLVIADWSHCEIIRLLIFNLISLLAWIDIFWTLHVSILFNEMEGCFSIPTTRYLIKLLFAMVEIFNIRGIRHTEILKAYDSIILCNFKFFNHSATGRVQSWKSLLDDERVKLQTHIIKARLGISALTFLIRLFFFQSCSDQGLFYSFFYLFLYVVNYAIVPSKLGESILRADQK